MPENEQQLREFIESLPLDDAPRESHRVQLLNALTEQPRSLAPKPGQPAWYRRYLVNPRIARWTVPAAAAAIIFVVLGLWPVDGAGPEWALGDVVEKLFSAKTLHIKGQVFGPIPFEYWIDLEKMRWRSTIGQEGVARNSSGQGMVIHDGEITLNLSYKDKTAEFRKLTPVRRHQELYCPYPVFIFRMLAKADTLEGTAEMGRETINGVSLVIREWQITEGDDTSKLRIWLDPATGQPARIQGFSKDSQGWQPVVSFDVIELNVELPDELFTTDPPASYALKNTRETARAEGMVSIDGVGNITDYLSLGYSYGLMLDDGTVIMGFRSWDERNKGAEPSYDLLTGFELGSPIPNWPVQVHAIRCLVWSKEKADSMAGRHLACTRRDGKAYEWAVYAPRRKREARDSSLYIQLLLRFPAGRPPQWDGKPEATMGIPVKAAEFDELVRGAMAEFSDDGKAPEHVTYENVMKLAEKIRRSARPEEFEPGF